MLFAIPTASRAQDAANGSAPSGSALPLNTDPVALSPLVEGRTWALYNRTVTRYDGGGHESGIRLDAKPGEGVAWIPAIYVEDGVIEVELQGSNTPGRSFVGIAFHGQDARTYEAVYVRPFNFHAADPAYRKRAIQYIAHPAYTWRRLREQHPGQYEAGLDPAPDPDAWLRLRIELDGPTVRAYVNDQREPALIVDRTSDRTGGWVGLFVGSGSGGAFDRLRMQAKPPSGLRRGDPAMEQ